MKGFHILNEASSFLSRNKFGGNSQYVTNADAFINGVTENSPAFKIVGLFTIPIIESSKLHLLAVLTNGTRIYLSLLCTDGNVYPHSIFSHSGPSNIEISAVRFAPPVEAIRSMLDRQGTEPGSCKPYHHPNRFQSVAPNLFFNAKVGNWMDFQRHVPLQQTISQLAVVSIVGELFCLH